MGRYMRARYAGFCTHCQYKFQPNSWIYWDSDSRKAWHEKCWEEHGADAAPAKPNPDAVTVVFRAEVREGQVFRHKETGKALRVEAVRFVPENEDLDQFFPEWHASCVPATDEETAALVAREELRRRRKEAAAELLAIKKQVQSEGERPAGQNAPEGDRAIDTETVYGGGDWFVIGEQWIWYVLNNGRDGDDWSLNNVRTGGAGAIGWRLPHDEAMAQRLRELEALLDGVRP